MINVCPHCGEYRADKKVEGEQVICPLCGHRHPFRCLPLFVLTGASGAGKSTVCLELAGKLEQVVVLESDILWHEAYSQPEKHREYFEMWLRVCKNISQAGQPVLLCGAGIGVPENMEPCVERRYFTKIHYLALTCDDDELAERLQRRPAWRKSSHETFVTEQLHFNRWFKENGPQIKPPVSLLDTTASSVQQSALQVIRWINMKLEALRPA